ncbi:MAG: hypothetical protein ACYCOR_20730 [Acidobacteriaceae bacterium]
MANPWFRMYTEFAYDPKVQVLTETLQRRYVMLLCLQCNDYYQNRPDDEVALSLRVTLAEWQESKKELISRGLLMPDGSIKGWENRQFISDLKDPTAPTRQQRYRDRKKAERNATVTSRLPDSDLDSDTDLKSNPIAQNQEHASGKSQEVSRTETHQPLPEDRGPANREPPAFQAFWKSYPRKKAKADAFKAWKSLKPSEPLAETILQAVQRATTSEDWRRDNGKFIPYPATWLRARRWEDEDAGVSAEPAWKKNPIFAGCI